MRRRQNDQEKGFNYTPISRVCRPYSVSGAEQPRATPRCQDLFIERGVFSNLLTITGNTEQILWARCIDNLALN